MVLLGPGLVVGDDVGLVVGDDVLECPVGLHHLLVMAAALDRVPGAHFLGHEGEDAFLAARLLVRELQGCLLDEPDVFDGLGQVPHAQLPVALLLVALPDAAVLLLVDQQQRPAGTHAFNLLGLA